MVIHTSPFEPVSTNIHFAQNEIGIFFKKTTFYEKSKIHPRLGIDQYYSDLQLGMIRKIWGALGVSKSIKFLL